ncbi:hypothetical protein AVEN_211438-1 [Araneus ventricosus]|uniref:Uncharacterized protein n=1 Tax=Araneus ventricosus TaxID=182803 RepID=A0A4Y2IIF5_ARAVE|nr:hypothetical protein AVEN_16322-1 [Araneus ventricosus]GBM76756.1 hypothetical protein AVEN_73431-1 [Araneus ventricosus]GBM76764.1 hypothetical protein AVEN_88293-1 [Araneus ventricosus]GBM76857.1 hypothetical protein AVEN_211438-1 [Araneus ventricosus]
MFIKEYPNFEGLYLLNKTSKCSILRIIVDEKLRSYLFGLSLPSIEPIRLPQCHHVRGRGAAFCLYRPFDRLGCRNGIRYGDMGRRSVSTGEPVTK